MKDRNVQFPMRFRDKRTGQILDLEPLYGDVIEVGSVYNKANVLPEHVCKSLGLNHITAEPKDAFAMVASGRYYGKVSLILESQEVGSGNLENEAMAKCNTLGSNDFGNIPTETGGKYSKLYVPTGAKKVKLTMSSIGARTTFGRSVAELRFYNGSQTKTLLSQDRDSNTDSIAVDVSGSGNEYFYAYLIGENGSDRGKRQLKSLMLEVTK